MNRQFGRIAYFVFSLLIFFFSAVSFAGDRHPYTDGDTKTGMEKCQAAYADNGSQHKTECVWDKQCPDHQDGGLCIDAAHYWYNPYTSGPGYTESQSTYYTYCYDATPTWNGTACVKDNPCKSKAGMYYNNGQYSSANLAGGDGAFSGPTSGGIPGTFCQDGCQMATDNLEGGASGSSWYGRGNPKYTGVSCTASDQTGTAKPPTSPEYDCLKSGKGFGYFNGNVICTDINNTQAKGTTTATKTNADGTKTEVKTDQSVKCDGTNCVTTTTTTTTTYNASGTATGTTTTTDSTSKADPAASGNGTKGDSAFCAQNPTSPMCKDGSFSGACSAGSAAPACDGDPVQCATAKATFEANCKAMKAGNPPTTTDPVGERKEHIDFQPVALGGGGSCPASRSVSVMGKSIAFDFSAMCDFAGVVRPVVIALGWLLAGYIVFGYRGKGS